jgi:hypothetical protein
MFLSVPKYERGPSEAEFLYNARQLQIHTIKKCANFPKKYRFSISNPLELSARTIHGELKKGNSINPRNQHEFQMRRDYFLRANAELYDFVSQLEVAKEVIGFDDDALMFWASIVRQEIRLVKGLLESDKKRYRNLP